jgi:hypothetical protein
MKDSVPLIFKPSGMPGLISPCEALRLRGLLPNSAKKSVSEAANNGQQPPHSPQHQQCVRSAIEKANFTVSGKIAENIKVPFKSAAVGAIDGGILGCLLTSEGGCFEGAIPGVLTGALGGAIEGTGDAVYHDITAYIQGMAQLKKDIAACPY